MKPVSSPGSRGFSTSLFLGLQVLLPHISMNRTLGQSPRQALWELRDFRSSGAGTHGDGGRHIITYSPSLAPRPYFPHSSSR